MKKHILLTALLAVSFGVTFISASAQTTGDIDPNANISTKVCTGLVNNLRIGSSDFTSNGEVTSLQEFLVSVGLLPVDPTGYFGNATFKAVKAFQTQSNLLNSGYVGTYTRAAIRAASCGSTTGTQTNSGNTGSATTNPCFVTGAGQTCGTSQAPTISSISPAQGSANTSSTIYGTNLAGVTSVMFYNYAGLNVATLSVPSPSVSSITSSSIVINLVGAFAGMVGPGTYQVKVVTPNGTSNASSFTVISPLANTSPCFVTGAGQTCGTGTTGTSFQVLPLKMDNNGPAYVGHPYTVCWQSGKDNPDQTILFMLTSASSQKGGSAGWSLGQAYLSQGCLSFTLPSGQGITSGNYVIAANNVSSSLYSNSPAFTISGDPIASINVFSNKDPNSTTGATQIIWNASAPTSVALDMVCAPGSVNFSTDMGNHPTCDKGGVMTWQGVSSGNITVTPSGNSVPITIPFTLTTLDNNGTYTTQKKTIYITFPATINPCFVTGAGQTCGTSQAPTISSISPAQVSANASATIYGTNFTSGGNPSVEFYDRYGSLVKTLYFVDLGNFSSQSISVAIPILSAGAYQVRVVTPAGKSNNLTFIVAAPSASVATTPTNTSTASTVTTPVTTSITYGGFPANGGVTTWECGYTGTNTPVGPGWNPQTNGCFQRAISVSISNSTTGFVVNGTALNSGNIYVRTTGVDQNYKPKGCAQPKGATGCLSPSGFRDFADTEFIDASTIQAAFTGGQFPDNTYETYVMYKDNLPLKVGTFTVYTQGAVLGATKSNICTDISRNIHRGDESAQTTKLQEFLIGKGILSEKVSGFYGDKTVEAVKAYQVSKGLPQTGMVYGLTRSAMKEETCE